MFKPKSEFLKQLVHRGYVHQCTEIEKLDELANNKKIVGYIGFDCTAQSLHIGSLIQLMLIRIMQKTGHKPIVVMGGGTSQVGDPSGKDKARKLLNTNDIKKNFIGIKKNIEKFTIKDAGFQKVKFVDNASWLNKINYIEFLRSYGKFFSVNKMLSMDSVNERLNREQSLSFLEFNYMILQAYDFVELNKNENCIVQFGGSDQWGNITSGVDLIRRINKKEAFGLTTPLITTSSGEKMGKTDKGAIWLDEKLLSSNGYWQYWRNVDDKDVSRFLKLFTEIPLEELEKMKNKTSNDINNNKKILADEATKLCHGKNITDNFIIKKNIISKGLEAFKIVSINKKIIQSNSEARRLIKGGAVRFNGKLIKNEMEKISNDYIKNRIIKVSIGKKKHFVIKIV